MNNISRKQLLWLLPLVVMVFFIALWGIWYLVSGSVPSTQFKFGEEKIIHLSLSRWWDIPLAPICAFFLLVLFTSRKIRKDDDLIVATVFFLVAGPLFGLVIGLAIGLVAGLMVRCLIAFSQWLARN